MSLTRSSTTPSSLRLAMPSSPHPLQCLDAIAAIRPCHRRQEICRQGQAANTWYWVLSGVALRCVIKPDGRRQIVDLLFRGDFFGLAAGAEYDYTVESATPGTVVAEYPRKHVESQADSNPQLARELRQITFDGLTRLQKQLMILGRITAEQKVASFIVEMADRLSIGRSDRVTLPISRYDIADYLAVSAETVSRALRDLKQRGLIRFTGTRVIQIMDREALEDGEYDEVLKRTVRAERAPGHPLAARLARTDSRTASAN